VEGAHIKLWRLRATRFYTSLVFGIILVLPQEVE
jgi:hypothetical protein